MVNNSRIILYLYFPDDDVTGSRDGDSYRMVTRTPGLSTVTVAYHSENVTDHTYSS